MGDFSRSPSLRTVVASADSKRQLSEDSLVLVAVGIPFAIVREGQQALLVVPVTDGLRAADQLAAYHRENRPATEPTPPRVTRGGWPGVAAFVLLLGGVHLASQGQLFDRDWTALGLLDGRAVAHGQWYRLLTALCLHADASHLVGNLFFGGLFGLFAAQLLGGGVAWGLVLLGGTTGNALDVLLRAESHRALGASTAVFAALGLLLALSWSNRPRRSGPFGRWAPLVAGMGLLGWLGTSGEHVDIPAHLYGLLSGLLLGWVGARLWAAGPAPPGVQWLAAAASLLALGLAWALALS